MEFSNKNGYLNTSKNKSIVLHFTTLFRRVEKRVNWGKNITHTKVIWGGGQILYFYIVIKFQKLLNYLEYMLKTMSSNIWSILPVYEIRQKCMYVLYISRFPVSSRPEIYSRYRPLSSESWGRWYHKLFKASDISNFVGGISNFERVLLLPINSHLWFLLKHYIW